MVSARDRQPVLSIRLLGPFAITRNGVAKDHLVKGPARRLFSYLLIHQGEQHARDLLAEMVSPENPASRSAFNTTLWRLKKAVCELPGVNLECASDTLGLSLEPQASLDVDRLLEASAHLAADRDHPGDDVLGEIADAVALWHGEFGCGLSDDWALVMRERTSNCYLQGLTALMRHAGRERRFEEALEYGMRILVEDPYREAIHCEAMWLLVLTGRRAKAITLHREFIALLRRELGIGPMPETTALYDYICNGLESAPEMPFANPHSPLTATRYRGLLETVERSRASVYDALQTMYPGD